MTQEWLDWYYSRYYVHGNYRFGSFLCGLHVLRQISGADRVIVETGTQRAEDDLGSGESTRIFGHFCSMFGGKVITVDHNRTNLECSRRVNAAYDGWIEYVRADSVEFLSDFRGKINLLYLDSLDVDWNNLIPAQQHALREIECTYDKLSSPSLVLIDDFMYNDNGLSGKGALARDFLLERGFIELYLHQQGVYLKPLSGSC